MYLHQQSRRLATSPTRLAPALIRLEDVGPGGPYATNEDLGRLRAVFSWLKQEGVPFHVALISRWKTLQQDGTWYEKGIDDPVPDPYTHSFISLLQEAQRRGALFGMHGYTHQYGDRKLPGNNQDSAIGSEFNLEGIGETQTAEYAKGRIRKSLSAFQKVGLYPAFWESPHYNDTPEQEDVFGSYVRVLYQPDAEGHAEENLYISPRGNLFIPAPHDYIHEKNTVADVLAKLEDFTGLASVFYHPLREFAYLERVQDDQEAWRKLPGAAANRLPVYRYIPGRESELQQLVRGFRQRGYVWSSLLELVPLQIWGNFQPPALFHQIPQG